MNLDLGGTIWLNVSRKLLSYHKWFFTPLDKLPPEIYGEFAHHSHTHSASNVTTSTVTHNHNPACASISCGNPLNRKHSHTFLDQQANSHNHSATISFAAANLGSPWYNHVHALSISCGNGGVAHTHSVPASYYTGANGCSYSEGVVCSSYPHTHYTNPVTLTCASGGATHQHTLTGQNSDYAPSVGQTPEAHTHTYTVTIDVADSHTHAWTGNVDLNVCYYGGNHNHAINTPAASTHNHTTTGTSGSGGESPPVAGVACRRLMVGVGL